MKEFCFEITQGTDRVFKFGGLSSAGETLNFTGYKAYLSVKASLFATRTIDALSVENGRIVLEDGGRFWRVTFPHDVTKGYPASRLVYDLKVKSAGGEIYSLVSGHIDVKKGVTNVL